VRRAKVGRVERREDVRGDVKLVWGRTVRCKECLFSAGIKKGEGGRGRGGGPGNAVRRRGRTYARSTRFGLECPLIIPLSVFFEPENEISATKCKRLSRRICYLTNRFSGHCSTYSNHSSKSFNPADAGI
jgi:hypothetical protein